MNTSKPKAKFVIKQPVSVKCTGCGKEFTDENVYQVRIGNIDEDGEFSPDEDVGLYHSACISLNEGLDCDEMDDLDEDDDDDDF